MSEIRNLEMTGGCACGAVRFKAHGPTRPVIACHCQTCRRTSGHYWAACQVYRDNFTVTAARGLKWFDSSPQARRGFCCECGASLFFEPRGTGRVSIAAGCLDIPTGLQQAEDICTDEAGDYYRIGDGLPGHRGARISERFALPARPG